MARGRPKGQMTPRREQVLRELRNWEGPMVWGAFARQCGIANFRNVKRIVAELNEIGVVNF